MQSGTVTTPFGRRPMTLALVRAQINAGEITEQKSIDKWKVFRDVAEARQALGLQDRTLTVLNALLSFYPETLISEEHGLVVFPSNAQLSLRAHGIAGTTLRRHLGFLVEAGIVHRRDSPNGKRYAHRSKAGEIEQAFGFSLTPLLCRAEEFAILAQRVVEERRALNRAREALTLCRRDVRKLISAAIDEGADGDWAAIEAIYIALIASLPRTLDRCKVTAVLDEMEMLREEVLNLLENQLKSLKMDGNDVQNGQHIQNSNSESIHDLEPRSEKEPGGASAPTERRLVEPLKAFPLSMVLKACPQIGDYCPGARAGSWRDLMAGAVVVRSMLGVSPSAYQEACEIMGAENAATVMACILERTGMINSPGGYLRDLTRKAERGEFSLGSMLMALMRANAGREQQSA